MKSLQEFLSSKYLSESQHRDLLEHVVADLDADYSPDAIQALVNDITEQKRVIDAAVQHRAHLDATLRNYQVIVDKMEAWAGQDVAVDSDATLFLAVLRDRMEEIRVQIQGAEPSEALRRKFLAGQRRRALLQRARAASACRDLIYPGGIRMWGDVSKEASGG